MGSGVVLVIGEDVEGQMARFRCFEETGWVDRHVVSIDVLACSREIWTSSYAEAEKWYVQDPSGQLHEVFEKNTAGKYLFIGHAADDGQSDPLRPPTIEQKIFGREYYVEPHESGHQRWRLVLKLSNDYKVVKAKRKDYEPFAKWLALQYGIHAISAEAAPELEGTEKTGWMRLDRRGEVIEAMSRTIPDGFWFPSWCVLEHAWKLKSDAFGDQAPQSCDAPVRLAGSLRKSDIDFEGMRTQVAIEAGESWDQAQNDPNAFENILIRGTYRREFIHLSRDQYIRSIQDNNLWNCPLILDGVRITLSSSEFQLSSADTSASTTPWFAYMNQLVDSLQGDTLMTMVGYRC